MRTKPEGLGARNVRRRLEPIPEGEEDAIGRLKARRSGAEVRMPYKACRSRAASRGEDCLRDVGAWD